MINYGYIKDFKTRDNYVLGGLSKLPKIILQENGQWNDLPEREIQNVPFETSNCTGYATSTAIEMIVKKKYGLKLNYSDRAVGIISGTYPPGNSPHKVAEAIRSKGLELEEFLPFKNVLNVDEYYQPSPLPESDKQRCLLWLDRYTFQHEYINQKDIKEALKYSPVCFAVYAWQQNNKGHYYKTKGQEDTHWVVCYGYDDVLEVWKLFDSYDLTQKLYTYDSEIETAKRYYVEEKTPQEQLKNAQLSLIQILQNYVLQLLRKIYSVGSEILSGVFSKRN